MKRRTLLLTGALGAFLATPAMGQTMVGNSAHDFTSTGWAGGEICKACHTPHNAQTEADGSSYRLWNHTLTTATYTLHDSLITETTAGPDDGTAVFDRGSRLCMSCHDGTVALDAFGGAAGSTNITGVALVGTDLRNDHPIGREAIYDGSVSWFQDDGGDNQLGAGDELSLRAMETSVGVTEYVVGCTTCHTAHYAGHSYQLRMDNGGSALCLACHVK